jgi:hypothetical protein
MTVPASAQNIIPMTVMVPCMNSGPLEKKLAKDHGESPVGAGITKKGTLVVLTNPQTGSFTVMMKSGNLTCLIASGTGYASTDPKTPGEPL